MRDRWYADKRDLLKWGGVVLLAKAHGIKRILYVACYVPEHLEITLQDGSGRKPVPSEVVRYFRNVRDIGRLSQRTGLRIEVFGDPYPAGTGGKALRKRYFERVLKRLQRNRAPTLVLLDPDTGLTDGRINVKHVGGQELTELYHHLRPGDLLVCYQHAWRRRGWQQLAKDRFAGRVGLTSGVDMVHAAKHDVILLSAKK